VALAPSPVVHLEPHLEVEGSDTMLYWAVIFFVIAIVAAIFGFGGIAARAAGIARALFIIALAFAVISFIMHFARRHSTA